MLQKLKSASLKKVLPGVIIMFLISAGLLIYFGPDFITWAKGPVPFEELTIDEIEDQYVTMTFELTWGTYATQVTTTTRNGAKVSERDSMQYHAVLVGGLDRYLYSDEDLYWERSVRTALLQSRQNELYNFPDEEKRWTVEECINRQQEMLEDNYRMMEEAANQGADLMVTSYGGGAGKDTLHDNG